MMFKSKQLVPVMVAGLLLFVVYRELIAFLYSPVLRFEGLGQYAFSLPFTFVFIGAPLLLVSHLGRRVQKRLASGYSLGQALWSRLDFKTVLAGLLLFFWILFSPILLFIDDFFPFTVLPLTTPTCALITGVLAFVIFRSVGFQNRVCVVAILTFVFIGTEYIDWNPRKPMIRHLHSITTGMTRADVRRRMAGHITNDTADEGDETISYITDHGGEYNADLAQITLEQGRVVGVWFSHD